MRIDHDYVAHVTLRSQGRQENSQFEFHQLDFGLTLPTDFGDGNGPDQATHSPDDEERGDREQSQKSSTLSAAQQSNITLRSNLVLTDDHSRATIADWRKVPGDLVERWRTDFLGPRLSELSQMQMDERNYYLPCVRCGRMLYAIRTEGPNKTCEQFRCSEFRNKLMRDPPP